MAVGVRLEEAERQVLQLPLQLPDAQAVGQRRVDVAGELGQRAPRGLGLATGRAHPRQLPRQQHRHHAQVLDDRQQQPAQAFAVAAGLAPGVQRPDLVGRILAIEQSRHRRIGGGEPGGGSRAQTRQVEQQRGDQGRLVGFEPDQGLQRVGDFRPAGPLDVVGARRLPCTQQRLPQRGGQPRRGSALQQGVQTVDGGA